jgi:hypothetical protein
MTATAIWFTIISGATGWNQEKTGFHITFFGEK